MIVIMIIVVAAAATATVVVGGGVEVVVVVVMVNNLYLTSHFDTTVLNTITEYIQIHYMLICMGIQEHSCSYTGQHIDT